MSEKNVCLAAPRVGCVVMASGLARRFGSNKLLADFAGTPVLLRTLAALTGAGLEPVVVTRSQEVSDLCAAQGVRCVLHLDALQSDTVRRGLAAVKGCDGCLFVPGDQPLLSPDSVKMIVSAFAHSPNSVVRLSYDGRPGSPILFPRWLFYDLRNMRGDVGGSALLKQKAHLVGPPLLVEAADELELCDVDTPDELATLEAAFTHAEKGGRA